MTKINYGKPSRRDLRLIEEQERIIRQIRKEIEAKKEKK